MKTYQKYQQYALKITLSSLLILFLCPAFGETSEEFMEVKGEIEFSLEKASSASALEGWYNHAGSLVAFKTESFNDGTKSVQGLVPDTVTVQLDVNGLIIDHTIDYKNRTLTMDGYGGMLTPEDVEVLGDFYPALEKALYEPQMLAKAKGESPDELSQSADALHRIATMYSEAPVWAVLDKTTIKAGEEYYSQSEMDEGPMLGDAAFEKAVLQDPESNKASCQRNGGQGITYLYKPCNTIRYNTQYHDARSHCYSGKRNSYGCKRSASCKGRCGAGCGWRRGYGTYSHDCHDHDWCARYHKDGSPASPTHRSCGDEWREASNDFAFGRNQCWGGCRW